MTALSIFLIGAGTLGTQILAHAEDTSGLHNLIQVSDRIYSGSEPAGKQSFFRLAAMGVTTIVSVDGAVPDVSAARAHGMRYVHIPVGYDGVDANAQSAMARVLEECAGSVYIHCHHGQHRGPAMAAIAWRIAERVGPQLAISLLECAQTSPDYPGLYEAVRDFDASQLNTDGITLHETAPVSTIAAEMAEISRIMERIELSEKNNWGVPPGHDDVVVDREATILAERLRELTRTGDIIEMETEMRESEELAWKFRDALRHGSNDVRDDSLRDLRRSCRSCHDTYRN